MYVVLIHGLGRTPLSMWGLARVLRAEGYATELFGYAAFAESYDRIVERLQVRLRGVAARGDYAIVAHSMGGLVARSGLADRSLLPPQHVVMLGTPNQSPRMARWAWRWFPFRWFARDCGARMADLAWYESLPDPHFPYTVVAGTRGVPAWLGPFGEEVNDGLVALAEAKVGAGDRLVEVPCFHTFLIEHPRARAAVLEALAGL